MASIFTKDPAAEHLPSPIEQIASEISHLKNKTSIRHGPQSKGRSTPWIASLVILLLIGLYVMDPFLYAMHKSDAIRAYLYLHNYDGAAATRGLAASGIFTTGELQVMDAQQGSFQDYYASTQDAEKQADTIVQYMTGLKNLHDGAYDKLDLLGKVRYQIFVHPGLQPPTYWSGMTPSVQ